jgi:hypothetical protein
VQWQYLGAKLPNCSVYVVNTPVPVANAAAAAAAAAVAAAAPYRARCAGTTQGDHTDSPTKRSGLNPTRILRESLCGLGSGRCYRFKLVLTSSDNEHCGTQITHKRGWLAGWAGEGSPPHDYSNPYVHHATAGVVRCEGFLLWRLANAAGCASVGYCTSPWPAGSDTGVSQPQLPAFI